MKKAALITGSTQGIGFAIAEVLAKNNFNLMIHGIDLEGESRAEFLSRTYKVEVFLSKENLLLEQGCVMLANETLAHFENLSVLVNNAGMQYVSKIEEFPIEKWNQILQLNLTSAFILSKTLWSSLKKSNQGRIINIASAHGLVASEYKSAYVASKHGLVGLTKTLALEGAPFGITVNAICPGYVKTAMVQDQIKDQAKMHHLAEADVEKNIFLQKHAIKKFVPLSLIADTVMHLTADHASCITGTSLMLDAGWTAQ